MRLTSGSYVGNGTSQSITGAGFAPVMVWVQRAGFADGQIEWKIPAMGSRSSNLIFVGPASSPTNAITSLDADGFSVGSNARVNSNTETYRWLAWENDAASIETGSYIGDGTASHFIPTSFAPRFALTQGEAMVRAGMRMLAEGVDLRSQDWGGTLYDNRFMRSLDSGPDGFTVGSFTDVNGLGSTYYYFCLSTTQPVTTLMHDGTYTGNGGIQTITAPGFQPDFVLIDAISSSTDAGQGLYKQIGMPSTLSVVPQDQFNSGGEHTNGITGFVASGFSLGARNQGNRSGVGFRYIAVQGSPPPAQTISPTSIVSEEDFGFGGVGGQIGGGCPPTIASTSVGLAGGNNTTVNVTKPSGTVSGDLLVAFHNCDGNSRILTPPAGFTTIVNNFSGGDQTADVSYKVAGPSEPANYTFTVNLGERQVVRMFRITDFNPGQIVHKLATRSSVGSQNPTIAAGPVTPTAPHLTFKAFFFGRNSVLPVSAENPSWTLEWSNDDGGGGSEAVQAGLSITHFVPVALDTSGVNMTATQTWQAVTWTIAGFCACPGDPVICPADATQGIPSAEAFGTPTITRVQPLGSLSPIVVAQRLTQFGPGQTPGPFIINKATASDFPPNREGGQGVAIGDLLIMLITTSQNNNFTPPPGWTSAYSVNQPPFGQSSTGMYKVADAADVVASSYSVTITGSAEFDANFVVIRGFDPLLIVHQLTIIPTAAVNPYVWANLVTTIPSLLIAHGNWAAGVGPFTGPSTGVLGGPLASGGESYDIGSPAGTSDSTPQSFPGMELVDQIGTDFTEPNSVFAFHSQPAAGTAGSPSILATIPTGVHNAILVLWAVGGFAPGQNIIVCPGIASAEVFGTGQFDPTTTPPNIINVQPAAPKDTGQFFGKQNPQPLAVDPGFTADPITIFSVLEPFTDLVEFVGKQNPEVLAVDPDFTQDPSIAGVLRHIHTYMDIGRFDPDDAQSDDR